MPEATLQMRMHTVVLRVNDLAASRKWYEEKLGMTVEYQDVPYKLLSLSDATGPRLTIWELREGELPTASSPTTIYPTFVSMDARGDYRLLLARGVAVTEPADTGLGLRFFWITDPDGHKLCVLEFLPE